MINLSVENRASGVRDKLSVSLLCYWLLLVCLFVVALWLLFKTYGQCSPRMP